MISVKDSEFCCGVVEIGNFNYVKDRGPKGNSHYHKIGGGWQAQKAATPTTAKELQEILDPLTRRAGGIVCTTGADQEYMEPILESVGFVPHEFKNRVHEQGSVKLWFLAATAYRAPKADK